MVLNPETAMQPHTQSVHLHDDLFLTIEPLGDGNINKIFFEKHSEGASAQPVPVPEGYKLIYKAYQEPAGRWRTLGMCPGT